MNVHGVCRAAVVASLLGTATCYTSEVPPIAVRAFDGGSPPVADGGDRCTPRRPWEDAGVTGMIFRGENEGLVLSKDRYYTVSFHPTTGDVMTWGKTGLLRHIWSDAPPILSQRPWEGAGVTAAYRERGGTREVIFNRFRLWKHVPNAESTWEHAGSVVDEWGLGDTPDGGDASVGGGPPAVDGKRPWEGAGITGSYWFGNEAALFIFSQDRSWFTSAQGDPTRWSWFAGKLADNADWQRAPPVTEADGKMQRPYELPAITAAWERNSKSYYVSKDKLWILEPRPAPTPVQWTTATLLKDAPGWNTAPANGCAP